MSHVSALPVSEPASVVDATAEATQFALATLTTSFPAMWEYLDAVDAVVGFVGLAAVGRIAVGAYKTGTTWSFPRWGGVACRKTPACSVE